MSYFQNYLTFEEIFESAQEFEQAYPSAYQTYAPLTNAELDFIYALLDARYAVNKTGISEERFKDKCMLYVFQYAPKLIKDLNVQKRLRALTEEEMMKGAVQKSTSGYNPSTDISGNTDVDIVTVNQQNLLKYTKGILDGYAILAELLKADVTQVFLQKFRNLFLFTSDVGDITEEE